MAQIFGSLKNFSYICTHKSLKQVIMLKKSLLLAVLMAGFVGTASAEEPEVLNAEVQDVQEATQEKNPFRNRRASMSCPVVRFTSSHVRRKFFGV